MKCEHCGKNEVNFVYRSNMNGKIMEKHLCGQCAQELGYSREMSAYSRRMMDQFFGGSLLEDFFAPEHSLLGRMHRMLEDPFDDFFAQMPALQEGAKQPAAEEAVPREELVEKEEQSRFSYLRKMNALKQEMKRAVREENFERAAQLRDEIHALEDAHKDHEKGA